MSSTTMTMDEPRNHDDLFETVQARTGDYDLSEDVEFLGRSVFDDDRGRFQVYVTSGGRVAVVDEEGFLTYGFLNTMNLSGAVRQLVEEALGRAVTPTFLDI